MSMEYKLPFTAKQIEEKLASISVKKEIGTATLMLDTAMDENEVLWLAIEGSYLMEYNDGPFDLYLGAGSEGEDHEIKELYKNSTLIKASYWDEDFGLENLRIEGKEYQARITTDYNVRDDDDYAYIDCTEGDMIRIPAEVMSEFHTAHWDLAFYDKEMICPIGIKLTFYRTE